ncbi:MAG: symmetrical bis(5'-nucleosyl)-tetraphosphatase [Pseudomonadota bacterium]|nr:symmetrical bis(5'-nucleosyl)-tetraphosphatase [Pseudomonadota bacterium]
MAVYAIGDLQGCYDELMRLLDHIGFSEASDTLWFCGDLVNRGPKSLEVLRLISNMNNCAVTVLGNHDLHLLAVAAGCGKKLAKDTLQPILAAPDGEELIAWLRHQPVLHHDATLGYTMVHAGLPPQWDLATAQGCARELEAVLRGPGYHEFLLHMYGNEPNCWSPELAGINRLRFITNALTRMRYCTAEGVMNLKDKGEVGSQQPGYLPWFAVSGRKSAALPIIFGHWSTLGVGMMSNALSLDSGCLWGGQLTAVRIDLPEPHWFSIECGGACQPG